MAAPETPAMLCARLREIAEDGDTSDVYGNRVMRAVALIETLTSPAATPVSEGGGGPTYVVNCCNCGRIVDTREKDAGGDGFGAELADEERWVCSPECWDAVVEPDLAKPASSPAGEWQPMSTAPKDGTRIDAWVRSIEQPGKEYRHCGAYWNAAQGEWQLGPYHAGQFEHRPEVTHWMPIPERPISTALSQSASAGRVGE